MSVASAEWGDRQAAQATHGVHSARALRLLVDTMGADHVMMGSDYPYPLGERPAGAVVRGADFLAEDERALILGGNAESFLDLTTTPHREAAS